MKNRNKKPSESDIDKAIAKVGSSKTKPLATTPPIAEKDEEHAAEDRLRKQTERTKNSNR